MPRHRMRGGSGFGGKHAVGACPTILTATKAPKCLHLRAAGGVLVAFFRNTTLATVDLDCGFRPCRSAIPADADHPFRQGDHPGRDAAG